MGLRPFEPALRHPGNRTVQYACHSFASLGVHELPTASLRFTATTASLSAQRCTADAAAPPVEVHWVEERQPASRKPSKRPRKQSQKPALELTLKNRGSLPAAVVASLPAAALPTTLDGKPLASAAFHRRLPEDVTPSLPGSMGEQISFVTVAAGVPPRTNAALCRCVPDADLLDGFVFLAGVDTPHPDPEHWDGHQIGFPLGGAGPWLCTQGFGGAGHHKGPTSHHAVDFACDANTPVCAVADGAVLSVTDSKRIGAAHVDLLPEANTIELRLNATGAVAVYLHLSAGSACVSVNQQVKAGDVLALSGNTGFTTGPHLHLQLNEPAESDDTRQPKTVMFSFSDSLHPFGVVPVAGYWYDQQGLVQMTQEPVPYRQPLPWAEALNRLLSSDKLHAPLDADDALHLARDGFLWLKPEGIDKGCSTTCDESDEEALRAFPSEHSCFVCNVVAAVDLLQCSVKSNQSRFAARGSVPAVYLSCACNFERDDATGEIFSYEICIMDHQVPHFASD